MHNKIPLQSIEDLQDSPSLPYINVDGAVIFDTAGTVELKAGGSMPVYDFPSNAQNFHGPPPTLLMPP
jgi:hypothetical protein